MENYFGLIEFVITALFAASWAILEWQGRRLDRKREADKADGTAASGRSQDRH
jgi:hypothetical protein